MNMVENSEAHLYCQSLVKEHDHDRYLTILYSPVVKRPALFALYAFNYEISRIREIVSQPMLGEIRLQWWREAIDDIFQGITRKHDILPALSEAIDQNEISRNILMAMIDGRAQELYEEPPQNTAQLEEFLSQTAGNLSCLDVHILGQRDIDDLARALGIAWGYLGIIRSVPSHLFLKKGDIPTDLRDKYGLSQSRFLSPDQADKNKPIIEALYQKVQMNLDFITAHKGRIGKASRSAFLLTSLARSYLKTIRKSDYNPFIIAEKRGALPRQWHLLTSAFLNRI